MKILLNAKDTFIRFVWTKWEALFHLVARVRPLKSGESYLFLVCTRRYYGKPFMIDEVRVRRFDPIIELHMNNQMLFQVLREARSVVSIGSKLLREVNRALPVLAESPVLNEAHGAKVLMGTTFINRGVTHFGFQTFPLRNKWFRMLTTWYLRRVFHVVNPHAAQLLKSHADVFIPKVVAMTKEQLIAQYATRSPN